MAMAMAETMAATTTDRRRRPSPFWLVTGSLAAFFVLLAFLAVQVRAGGDPALGAPKQTAAVATAEPRRVIIHRVIVRRVIITDPAPTPAPVAAAPAPAPAPSPPPRASRPRPGAGSRAGPRRARPRHHGLLMNELVFPSMGTTVRLLADAPLEPLRAGIEASRRG